MKTRLGLFVGATLALNPLTVRAQDWSWAVIAGAIPNSSSLAVDGGGNAYVNANYGSDGVPSLVKLDPLGNLLWARSSYGGALSAGPGGEVYVAGEMLGGSSSANSFGGLSGGTTNGTSGVIVLANRCTDRGMFLVKFDSTGNALWGQQAMGFGARVGAVGTDQSGNAFVTGSVEYDASFSSRYAVGGNATNGVIISLSQGQTGTYLAKYDPAGNLLWAEDGGGVSLAIDTQGSAYTVGNFSGTLWLDNSTIVTNASGVVTNVPGTLTNLTSSGSTDMSLIKYDPSGKLLWARGLLRIPMNSDTHSENNRTLIRDCRTVVGA
jgi:hypothetical protein